jgi:thioester reductase-like protein
MNRYLVTGATGVVGAAVVGELLRRDDVEIYVLLRATDIAHAARRVEQLAAFLRLPEQLAMRVRPLVGDMASPRFGLDARTYATQAEATTHIVHAAGVVRMNLPLTEARRSAVEGARNVLALAHAAYRHGTLRKVEFVSTVGVAGRRAEPLPETWLHESRRFHNSYEQSKAEAEDCVEAAVAEGLPVTVHRPSMVVGDSKTGRTRSFQIFYHLVEFITGRRSFGLQPDVTDRYVDVVPVDFVARAVCWSSTTPATSGRVLNLAAGPSGALSLAHLRTTARAAFRGHGLRVPPQRVLPAPVLARLARCGAALPVPQRKAFGTLPIFLDYLQTRQVFENRATLSQLAAGGIVLPSIGSYLDVLLEGYLRERYSGRTGSPAHD